MPGPQNARPGQQGGGSARPASPHAGSSPNDGFTRIAFTERLDPELFNSIAKDAAQTIHNNAGRDRNKTAQLRRFYDELCLWETRVNQQPQKFDEYLPFIRMLNAKVAYAEGRKLVDSTFVSLMHHTLTEVKGAGSLSACKLFWEAFMGFYKQVHQD